jgi:hypothetical protein
MIKTYITHISNLRSFFDKASIRDDDTIPLFKFTEVLSQKFQYAG